ncbi:MAG: hypothetical protein HRS57_00940 [Mycoplasmataceae bacterium]|nr:hypothetical protein [Mycoplasmataceae bacterium]
MEHINLVKKYNRSITEKNFTLMSSFLSDKIITQIIDGINTTEETKVLKEDFVNSIKKWLTNLDSFNQKNIDYKTISFDSKQVKISVSYINEYYLNNEDLTISGTFYYVIDVNSNKITKMLNIIKEKNGDEELLERAYFK